MVKRIAIAVTAVLPLCVPARSMNMPQAQTPTVLRGIVNLNGDPSTGSITISSGAELLQTVANYSFVNGTFAITLNTAATKAVTTGHARITVDTTESSQLQNVHLMADVQGIDPDQVIVFVNAVTSIVSAYSDLNTQTGAEDAGEQVGLALGIGTLPQSPHVIDFDSQAFLAKSELNGGFDNLVKQVAWEITTGAPLSIPKMTESKIMARAATLNAAAANPSSNAEVTAAAVTAAASAGANNVFLDLVKSVCTGAASHVGGALAGWVIDQILGPTGSDARIDAQLKEIGAQQQLVLDGISDLSAQIANLQKAITNQIKLSNYQRVAQDVKTYINDLLNMESQLLFLTKAGLSKSSIQYAQTLQARIQNSAGADLLNIWDGVEGDTTLGFSGLIDLWSELIGPGRGAPIFTDNKYLKRAVPQEQYFFGAEAIGLNLEMELAHSLGKDFPELSEDMIKTNYDAFNKHHDIEMKLLAHNRDIAGLGLYAARALPDSFDNYTIDTRSGFLWSRNKAPDGLYQAYPSNPVNGFQTITDYVSQFNSKNAQALSQALPGIKLDFNVPTREEWKTLTATGSRASAAQKTMSALDWLTSQGFQVTYLSSIKYSYWTSDVARSNGTSKTFPNWDNWVIDLYASPAGIIWYLINNNPNDPIKVAQLLLMSRAPLDTNNQIPTFLYKTGQDVFPLK